ncbi:Na+/H+ antiporter [Microbulbifer taiwanensis]|uniref:Na+/H+ antiporter n=1 Tax=Microbulbifer taiwanensis TaxID=986746 RepID=UPI003607854C
MFLDGWRIPKGAFFRDLRPILTLAVGLVIFTVVGMGFFIHWLVPSMPLAVSFAVAAILAPTDPVAVSAVRGDTPVPPRMHHILEGEALLNDASGLDLFRIAVAAVVTGSFSLMETAVGFVWVACVGVAIGVAVSFVCGYALRGLARIGGEDTGVQILVSLLLPFAAYLAAEHLGGSGILAAATAGIASHYVNLHGSELSTTRMERRAVWNMVQGVMNGVIFLLLGEQLVRIFTGDLGEVRLSHFGVGVLLFYVAAITAALLALRFIWVWVPLYFSKPINIQLGRRGRLLLVTAASVAGVRGVITLAGVLSLPLLLPDGSPFPARHLAVVIATGVILLSLLLACLTLPALIRRLPTTPQLQTLDDELGARQTAARAAIARLESLRSGIEDSDGDAGIEREALDYLLELYRRRLTSGDSENDDRIWALAGVERQFRLAALAAERDQLYQLRFRHQIDDELHRKLVLEVDLLEASLGSRG